MNITYVTWLETLDHPIMKAQVLDVCEMIAKSGNSLRFVYFSHPHFVEQSKTILEACLPNDAQIHVQPVWFTKFHFRRLNWIFLRPFQAKLVRLFVKNTLKNFLTDSDVIHFRSYPSSTAIPWIAKTAPTIRTVFDPRSPYPNELTTLGLCSKDSKQYKFWYLQESAIIDHASTTVTTTQAFAEELARNCASGSNDFEIIPNNVSQDRFQSCGKRRPAVRSQLDIGEHEIVFGYVGSLGGRSWNRPQVYIDFMKQLMKSDIKFCMLFVTNNDDELLRELKTNNIENRLYRIRPAKFDQVPELMAAMDLSLNLMCNHDPRLSIKTVEYLASNLPVITNSKAEGISRLVTDQSLGIVIEDEKNLTDEDIAKIKTLILNKSEYSSRATWYVENHCSTEAVTKSYLRLYKKLVAAIK